MQEWQVEVRQRDMLEQVRWEMPGACRSQNLNHTARKAEPEWVWATN